MTATSTKEAWAIANNLFPTDYEKDYEATKNAGYPIFRHRENGSNRICDLGTRLEVTVENKTTNIWIEEPKQVSFTAVVTYKIHNDEIMTKTMTKIIKVEKTFDAIGGKSTEVIRVYNTDSNWATWAAEAIINISLIAE